MILEALQYAATNAVTAKEFRPFVRSSVGLWSRAGRCAKAWADHEENCKAFIRDATSGMKQRRTAVVLGSGLLRDVPIEDLARTFDTVVLIDLVHLATVRSWLAAKRLRNVRLISRDLSGFEDAVAGRQPEPFAFMRQVPYLDLAVSANILSQIGVGSQRRLERERHPAPAPLLKMLAQAHLDGLAGLPCKTVLLTDIRYEVSDRDGQVIEDGDLLYGASPPDPKRRWLWPVAPYGELARNSQAVHEVVAV
ncbi:hypothetical protein EPK99_15795 [Neorhizobium lilium]|uniref:Uncharacterized protein n=1 Tax=Neorhizobium lilium TaxID=2503024 RepID=A0A444LGC4_9HYPH|nr:hypothetical protein [Neorhizobium lilium]RWX77113.1 hypothetical protein EPK99_15795 [Neorhizobium lilium]